MFLENYIETVDISSKLQAITYRQDKVFSVLKPAAKDKELTFLIGRIASFKDKTAFSELFKLVGPRIKGYLMKLGSSDVAAEDILQEVMLTVWRKSETFDRSKAAVSTWLFTIARNKRIDMLRKEIRPQLDPLDPMLSPNQEAAADDIYGSNQEAIKISKAIEQLPTDQAVLIKMTYYEDKSHSIIADELKMPLGTVKSRIRLASTRLRKLLEGKIYD
ncbi:sigma-70 family RNA polymerase sigma factor [Alphaproteobacteria bacterium]|jgi:RNA polymerase sigma-70 factor, ECF subfamily|nr:sigma-70 family RNA polymerase sigma factor [Alphaproteobacteria bacterium]